VRFSRACDSVMAAWLWLSRSATLALHAEPVQLLGTRRLLTHVQKLRGVRAGLSPPSAFSRWACEHEPHPDLRNVISIRYADGTPTGMSNLSSPIMTSGPASGAHRWPRESASSASGDVVVKSVVQHLH